MSKIFSNSRKYSSIRTLLIVWFLLFSIIPLVFMGWYFLFKFERTLEKETIQRLKNNGREVEAIVSDYYSSLYDSRDSLINTEIFLQAINEKKIDVLKELSTKWLLKSTFNSVSFYSKNGLLLLAASSDRLQSPKFSNLENEKIILNEKYLNSLHTISELAFVDQAKSKLALILFSKVMNKSNNLIGYVEQVIEINSDFFLRIKQKMKIEGFAIDEKKVFLASSSEFVKKIIIPDIKIDSLYSFEDKKQTYGFIFYPLSWGKSEFNIALGSVRQESQDLIRTMRIAFLSVLTVISFLLFITVIFTTNWFLKPVNRLINGLRAFDSSDKVLQLPVGNRTEIGLLTQAFNEMSYKIYQTRADLKKKITELESINNELKEAQIKLVHSAKMTSLGHLVAGVAHELNNPIGFIFSNMTHLKDYSDKLFQLIAVIEKSPHEIEKKKIEIEYEFIQQDLPRLIKSCQEGAERTRDIVLGLRNFSRIEEAQVKEIDIKESLLTTLELLSGEIKNRIKIHTQFENLPKIQCYASQINQVFMNILSNSVQAINGAGQIWIGTSGVRVSAGQPAKVQITIQDSGSGMDPEISEKIFEPFFTTKGIGKGTGLGLSISYGIIQNHGGEILVKSQKSVGTEFTIIIPTQFNFMPKK